MTEIQRMMLAVCFGGMVGLILADTGTLVRKFTPHKRRKRKEEKEAQQQSK